MTIHIISTVNGLQNEGMRNIATHYGREFEKHNKVLYSGLKDAVSIIKNTRFSDVTIIFARANKIVYRLVSVLSRISKAVWLVFVQKPDSEFLCLYKNRPLKCGIMTLSKADTAELNCPKNYIKYIIRAGIDLEKFSPADTARQCELKLKYGFDPEKKLVVHVGHCSAGRGLEDFSAIQSDDIDKMVVASGMFENEGTADVLKNSGVRLHTGYLEHVEEIYQMADVYLFPTKSSEYVISIPLSVMEALACGTPVIAYRSFENLSAIEHCDDALILIESADEIEETVEKAAVLKKNKSLLTNAVSWAEAAADAYKIIEGEKH